MSSNHEILVAFMAQLRQLQDLASQANPDGRSLQQQFLSLQQTFQQGILQISETAAVEQAERSVVSYQTEINRTLRLLGIDVSFMQTTRQSATLQKRQAQMRDRLTQLLTYGKRLQLALGLPVEDAE